MERAWEKQNERTNPKEREFCLNFKEQSTFNPTVAPGKVSPGASSYPKDYPRGLVESWPTSCPLSLPQPHTRSGFTEERWIKTEGSHFTSPIPTIVCTHLRVFLTTCPSVLLLLLPTPGTVLPSRLCFQLCKPKGLWGIESHSLECSLLTSVAA